MSDSNVNLYFVREGLQRLFLFRLPKGRKINFEGAASAELDVKTPDLVAVRLPADHIGRTFRESGRMYEPEPLKSQPLVTFSAINSTPTQVFKIRYDLPQPSWFSAATPIGLKTVGLLLPLLLLVWTKTDKVEPKRYKFAASIVGILIVGIYGSLIFATIRMGGDVSAIFQDIAFAIGTGAIAWVTYWMTTKPPTQEAAPPGPAVL